jgi:hypothetical protein
MRASSLSCMDLLNFIDFSEPNIDRTTSSSVRKFQLASQLYKAPKAQPECHHDNTPSARASFTHLPNSGPNSSERL